MEARPPGKRRPIVTTDVAVLATRPTESARLRDEHHWPVVFDANALILDVIHNALPDKKPSALMDAVMVGTARLYGKPDLLDEVAEHLPQVAARKAHDLARVHEVLAFYASRIRLVDPAGVVIPDTAARFAAVDARRAPGGRTDEPTARLSRILDPSILLTADRDLLDNGFGVWYEPNDRPAPWTAAAFTLKDRSFASQMDSGSKMFGVAMVAPFVTGAGLLRFARTYPRAALGAGALAVAFAYLTHKSPRWAATRQNLSEGIAWAIDDLAERLPADPTQQQQDSADAIEQLRKYRFDHTSPGSEVAIVARTLAIAPSAGLTAKEIYDSTGHSFAVLPVLDGYPGLFSQGNGTRWLLGRSPADPGG